MDLGTIITAAIMLAVCVLPFVLMNRKKQKRIKHLKQTFINFAQETTHNLGEMDVCGEMVIGTDAESNHIFFVKEHESNTTKVKVELTNISSVSIVKNHLNESSNFDKIGLNFHPKGNSSKLVQFAFFDSDDKRQLDGELQLADKWHKVIIEKL